MLNHHQLEITFGILGNVVSFFVFLAPVPTFYRIFKKKSTEGFHSLPYLVALFSCMLWLWYADIKGNSLALITINSFGCIVEILYIVMYLVYAPRATRNGTLTLLITMDIGLFSLIVLATDYFTTGGERIAVAGWICVGISVSVFAAPLSIMARVIRTRSVEFMPFYLSFSLTVSAIMWLGYGVFKKDLCVSIPNIAGFALGFAQMVLYGKYRNAEKVIIIDEKLPERIKDVVILPLGIVEIHPVEVKVTVKGEIRADEEPKNGDNNNGRAGKDNEQTVKVPDVEAGVK